MTSDKRRAASGERRDLGTRVRTVEKTGEREEIKGKKAQGEWQAG